MNKSEYKLFLKGFGFLAGILFALSSCQNSTESLQSEINLIATKFVPDHRIGICDIKLKSTGKTIVLKGETTEDAAKKNILKALDNQNKVFIDSIIVLPDTTINKRYFGLVTLSVINLRKEPDHASELVSQARLGTPVIILKEHNSWLLIQTPDNYISWTEKSSIVPMNRHEMAGWKNTPRVIYLDNTGWLYDTTIVNSDVVGDLVAGSVLVKTNDFNGYVKVALPDGRKGYILKQKVMDFNVWKNTIKCTEENICSVAKTFLGLPYLWGGSSTKGVDCSGFVQSVYFLNGLILQRDASLQALHGSFVDISTGYDNLKSGDLLFFGSKENGKNHVTHVAIYMGHNDYINSSGRVMINSLDSTKQNYVNYRMTSLLSAKRIIGTQGDPGIVQVNKHTWY
jgi:SH3-like domain-containing protein